MKRLLMVLCVASILLAACGDKDSGDLGDQTQAPSASPAPTSVIAEPAAEPVNEQERTTVRFAVFDWDLPLYEDLLKAFEKENPDLHVQVVSSNKVLDLGPIGDLEIPPDANQRLVAAADVAEIEVSRQTVREGLISDITPYMEADPNFQVDDFYGGALESFQWDGGTWALPTNLTFRLIYFSKDAFDEAGIPYPEANWTWDDLLVRAKSLTKGEGEEITFWGLIVPPDLAYRMIESRVGTLVDLTADPPKPRFDEAAVIDAVRWYVNLYLKEQVMPYSEAQEGEVLSAAETLIDQGKAAMWPDFDLLWWYRNQQGNVGVAPWPADTAQWPSTPAWAESLVMSAGTSQPEAAWRLIEFLSRQSVAGLGPGMKTIPARRSAVEVAGFWDGLDEELANTLRYVLDNGYVTREPVGYNAFDSAVRAVLGGEKSAEDAMADAQAQAETDIQEALAEASGATPVPTFVVAPPEEETPAAEGAETITYIPGIGSLNLEPYRALADEYHAMNPDVVVEVKMLDIMGATTPDMVTMAKSADCFQWYPGFQEAKIREAILNLEPFLDADPSFATDDYFPEILDQFTWQGQLWGLPADVTPFIIEYNKDLFDAAGIEYPAKDWNWDDFLSAAVALTHGEGDAKQYGYIAEVYESSDLLLMLERLGADLIDDTADPPAFTYNDPSVVEAMRWYANLTLEHGAKPAFLTDITKLMGASSAYLDRESLINSGRVGMWTNVGTTAALFGEREGLNLGAAPVPIQVDGTRSGSLTTTSGHFISSSTEHRQACWQWITFLSSKPAVVQGFPARHSVAESNEYRDRVGAELADAYMAGVADSGQPSDHQIYAEEEWMGGALVWFTQAYGKVLDGKASVEDALEEAQQLSQDYRACVIAAGDFDQETWVSCAKRVDPTLPDFLFPAGG